MASVDPDSGDSLSLNIMPMLDIFSILLTFLLMSYSTDPVNHDVDQNLELPNSETLISLDEVPTVIVNRNEILINDKKIVDLVGGKVQKKDLSQGAIFPVFKELEAVSKSIKAMENKVFTGEGKKKTIDKLSLEMDKDHDFRLIKRIMLSAQQAEFISFKLVVGKQDI